MSPKSVVASCTGALSWLSSVRTCISRIEGDEARAEFWKIFLDVHRFIIQLNLSKFSEHTSSTFNTLSKHLSTTLDQQKESLELALKERKEAEKLAKTSNRLGESWSRLITAIGPLRRLGEHVSNLAGTIHHIIALAIDEDENQRRNDAGTWQNEWRRFWSGDATFSRKKSATEVIASDLVAKDVPWPNAIWHMLIILPIAAAIFPRLLCAIFCSLNPYHIAKWMNIIMVIIAATQLYYGLGSVAQCVLNSFAAFWMATILSIVFECIPRKVFGVQPRYQSSYGRRRT